MRNSGSKKKLAILLSFLLLGVGVYFWLEIYQATNAGDELAKQIPVVEKVPSPAPPQAEAKSTPAVTEMTLEESSKKKALDDYRQQPPIEKMLPQLEDVKAEVAKDPHGTPVAILNFADQLGKKLRVALRSESTSRLFLQELDQCASATRMKTTHSASAMCIQSAYKVSAKYKNLDGEADKVAGDADPDTQKIYRGMKRLGL